MGPAIQRLRVKSTSWTANYSKKAGCLHELQCRPGLESDVLAQNQPQAL